MIIIFKIYKAYEGVHLGERDVKGKGIIKIYSIENKRRAVSSTSITKNAGHKTKKAPTTLSVFQFRVLDTSIINSALNNSTAIQNSIPVTNIIDEKKLLPDQAIGSFSDLGSEDRTSSVTSSSDYGTGHYNARRGSIPPIKSSILPIEQHTNGVDILTGGGQRRASLMLSALPAIFAQKLTSSYSTSENGASDANNTSRKSFDSAGNRSRESSVVLSSITKMTPEQASVTSGNKNDATSLTGISKKTKTNSGSLSIPSPSTDFLTPELPTISSASYNDFNESSKTSSFRDNSTNFTPNSHLIPDNSQRLGNISNSRSTPGLNSREANISTFSNNGTSNGLSTPTPISPATSNLSQATTQSTLYGGENRRKSSLSENYESAKQNSYISDESEVKLALKSEKNDIPLIETEHEEIDIDKTEDPKEFSENERVAKYLMSTLANRGVQTGGSKKVAWQGILRGGKYAMEKSDSSNRDQSHLDSIYSSLTPSLQFVSEPLENRFRREYNVQSWKNFLRNASKGILVQITLLALSLLNLYNIEKKTLHATGIAIPVLATIFGSIGTQVFVTGINLFEDAAEEESPGPISRFCLALLSTLSLFTMVVFTILPWTGLFRYELLISIILPQMLSVHILSLDGFNFLSRVTLSIITNIALIIINSIMHDMFWGETLAPLAVTFIWIIIFSIRETSLRIEYLIDLILRTQSDLVQEEMVKSSRVLKTVMPPRIIMQLLSDPGAMFYEDFKNTTVLHMDIAGFTAMSSTMEPFNIFKMLNTLFVYFDRLTEDFNVEKITTIGMSSSFILIYIST